MKFCDVYCCFENCENKGVYPFNFSRYHKICDIHQGYILNSESIICSYCQANCRIIKAIAIGKPLCVICNRENTVHDYTNLCFDCYNSKRCSTCFHISKKPQFRECGHEYCEVCIEKCFICNNICDVCFEQDTTNTKYNCGHLRCSNCIYKNCEACKKEILCVRCNKNGYFQGSENYQTALNENRVNLEDYNWVCRDCRYTEAKNLFTLCQNCNTLGLVAQRECLHDYCQNCFKTCNLCEFCTYCSNYSSLTSKPCSHQFCGNCIFYPCPYCCKFHNTLFTFPDCSHAFCSLCQNVNYCLICQKVDIAQQVDIKSNIEAKNEISSFANSEIKDHKAIPDERGNINKSHNIENNMEMHNNLAIIGDPYSLKLNERKLSAKSVHISNQNEIYKELVCQTLTIRNSRTKCINCGSFGNTRFFACNHTACEYCFAKQFCKLCQKNFKSCIMCPKKAQQLALLGCGHDACWKCLEKECKFCTNSKATCINCNKYRYLKKKLNNLNQPCGHDYCLECISNMKFCKLCTKPFCTHNIFGPCKNCSKKCELCSDLLKFCDICNSNSFICDNSKCRNNNCETCQNFFNPCSLCKNLCLTSKCGHCSKYICFGCSDYHSCSNFQCLKCEKKIMANISVCIHPFCQSCFDGMNKTCHFCHLPLDTCPTCLSPGFKKMIFDCKHLGCSNCFKNKGCFNCTFNKRLYRTVEYINSQCIKCKVKSNKGFNLLCGHFVCENCSLLDWSCLNFYCLKCIFTKENSTNVCFECKKNLIIKVKGKFFIKVCCQYRICEEHVRKIDKEFCLYCYEEDMKIALIR